MYYLHPTTNIMTQIHHFIPLRVWKESVQYLYAMYLHSGVVDQLQ